MTEKERTEISAELLRKVRELADEQGRSESAVLEEAVAAYLSARYPATSRRAVASQTFGADIEGIRGDEPLIETPRRSHGFLALLDRTSSRFDLDEDEAMDVALREQRAFRLERRERTER